MEQMPVLSQEQNPKLTPELVSECEDAMRNLNTAKISFQEVLESMASKGMSNDERRVYVKIVEAVGELNDHDRALRSYLANK